MTGYIFDAVFIQGVCSGLGKLCYPNGNVYFGQHKEFQREGLGKLVIFSSQDTYEGEWYNDKRNGRGRQETA